MKSDNQQSTGQKDGEMVFEKLSQKYDSFYDAMVEWGKGIYNTYIAPRGFEKYTYGQDFYYEERTDRVTFVFTKEGVLMYVNGFSVGIKGNSLKEHCDIIATSLERFPKAFNKQLLRAAPEPEDKGAHKKLLEVLDTVREETIPNRDIGTAEE